jgi:hypothetical protein
MPGPKFRLGQVLRDPHTGDKGRVVGFAYDGAPLSKTDGGRLFTGGKHLNGRQPSLSERYFSGELKACNCAGCRVVLLGSCHKEDVRLAKLLNHDVTGLPELVAEYVNGRPYCRECLDIGAP